MRTSFTRLVSFGCVNERTFPDPSLTSAQPVLRRGRISWFKVFARCASSPESEPKPATTKSVRAACQTRTRTSFYLESPAAWRRNLLEAPRRQFVPESDSVSLRYLFAAVVPSAETGARFCVHYRGDETRVLYHFTNMHSRSVYH